MAQCIGSITMLVIGAKLIAICKLLVKHFSVDLCSQPLNVGWPTVAIGSSHSGGDLQYLW